MKVVLILALLSMLLLGCVNPEQESKVKSSTTKSILTFASESRAPLSADKVTIDNKDFGSAPEGKISIEGLDLGEHQLVLIIKGAKYTEKIHYNGNDIALRLGEPVNAKISVWGKFSKKPITNVKVFLDEDGVKCSTNSEGVCSFAASPGRHTIKLQGDGIFLEEIKEISAESSSFSFNAEITGNLKLRVIDDLGAPLTGAQVSVGGFPKGLTTTEGSFELRELEEGQHVVELSYKDVVEKTSVTVPGELVTITLKTPKTVTIKILDELTNGPVSEAEIYFDSLPKGITDSVGEIRIIDVKQGQHTVGLKYKQVSKTEIIQVSGTQTTFTTQIKAPRIITLKILDLETKKKVDDAKVFLDGKEVGRTIQTGEVVVNDILPGTYTLSLEQLSFALNGFTGSAPSTRITIGSQTEQVAEVDMPNPIIQTGVTCTTRYTLLPPARWGNCKVSLINQGKVSSFNTVARLKFYPVDSAGKVGEPASDTIILNFGNIPPGQSIEKSTGELDEGFKANYGTSVVLAVLDGWKYTPDNKDALSLSTPLEAQVINDAVSWCKGNSEQCVTLAAKFVKTVVQPS